jgi:hypothetical protein
VSGAQWLLLSGLASIRDLHRAFRVTRIPLVLAPAYRVGCAMPRELSHPASRPDAAPASATGLEIKIAWLYQKDSIHMNR